jgi:hypothetical protein
VVFFRKLPSIGTRKKRQKQSFPDLFWKPAHVVTEDVGDHPAGPTLWAGTGGPGNLAVPRRRAAPGRAWRRSSASGRVLADRGSSSESCASFRVPHEHRIRE